MFIKSVTNQLPRSIVCLNGSLPSKNFFDSFYLPIIAADGAANTLMDDGIVPDVVVGDLDSLHPWLAPHLNVIKIIDQNTSAVEKALSYARSHHLLPAIVVGVHGGFLDHIYHNLNTLLLMDEEEIVLYTPDMIGYILTRHDEKQHPWTFPLQTKVSIMGFGDACVSTTGLKWELKRMSLSFPGKTSCFNRTTQDIFTITLHSGKLLVLIYTKTIKDSGQINILHECARI